MNMEILVEKAKQELDEEKEQLVVSVIKERLQEIVSARKILDKLEKQYNELIAKDVECVINELDE